MAFTIPVAFVVNAATEEEAAERLVQLLAHVDLVGVDRFDRNNPPHDLIDCWWTPNHPDADGSDGDDRLVWQSELDARAADARALGLEV